MIQQVTIKNFKCLRDVSVNLKRFTVFVGANGSGKTSILQAIDLLCRTFRSQQPDLENQYLSNRSYGSTEDVELSCRSGDMHFRYRTNPQPQQKQWSGSGASFAEEGQTLDWKPWKPQQEKLPNPVWLRLSPTVLRRPQPAQDIRNMEDNGNGMHRALSSMLLERRADFFRLEEDLRRIVPSVEQLQPTADHEIRFDTINGKGLTALQVSEGTLLTLGLLTAVHGLNKPGVLLLDDLDRALHPKAQRELIDLLRGVQDRNPEMQIIGSTHSPYMLDKMTPDEVLITSLRADGSTACEPLTQHPKFDAWKDEFHPGEMWSFFGEKWVAEPEAAAP